MMHNKTSSVTVLAAVSTLTLTAILTAYEQLLSWRSLCVMFPAADEELRGYYNDDEKNGEGDASDV